MVELELKFIIPHERLAALTTEIGAASAQRTKLLAHYFDTEDSGLAARRIALRLRKEGRRWVQTVKAEGEGPLVRLEHNVAVKLPVGAAPQPDPARHQGSPAGDALAAALADLPQPLVERYRTDIVRRTLLLSEPAGEVELALDEGRIIAGERSAVVCELELELKSGEPAALVAPALRLAAGFGLWLSTVSKAERGERLARDQVYGPSVKAAPLRLDESMAGVEVLRAVVQNCLAQILPNASEVAAGSDEAEHVHQLRVGLRRLRTALRELGDLAGHELPDWDAVLTETFRRLGSSRDLEIIATQLAPQIAAAGGPVVTLPGTGEHVDAAGIVREPAFQAALIELIGFSLEHGAAPGEKPVRVLRKRLERLHRKVAGAGRDFLELPPVAQHRVRKQLKRLRYLAEFSASLFGEHAVERYVSRLRPAQDALGLQNDEAMALERYRETAADDPGAWFAVGWLSARREPVARRCRRALKQIADAPRFWKK